MSAQVKVIAVLLAFIALAGAVLGYGHYQYGKGVLHTTDRYELAIKTQQAEAATLLATLTKEKLDALAALANLKAQLEKTREDLQLKNAADLRARRAGPSLRFTTEAAGCGRGGGGAESPAPGATPDAGTAVVQLPRQISDDLWQQAGDAQRLAIDYGVLYSYVHNPKLVCELVQ